MNLAKAKMMTIYFSIAALIIILAFDGWVMLQHGQEATISWMVISYSYDQPLVPFLAGVVCGHFWWQLKRPKEGK